MLGAIVLGCEIQIFDTILEQEKEKYTYEPRSPSFFQPNRSSVSVVSSLERNMHHSKSFEKALNLLQHINRSPPKNK